MPSQQQHFNPHLSVDCVIFGFTGKQMKVLLIERTGSPEQGGEKKRYKLPGDLIHIREDLDAAAKRVLYELTGLKDIFLHQFSVFGEPDRISVREDKDWLEQTTGMKISRVVTTAYYSLIGIGKSNTRKEISNKASWHDINKLPELFFDHREIIYKGLESLRKEIRYEPICFELLPEKFTIRQIQTLYEVILNQALDNRNFRKKLLKASYIRALNIKQRGVAHKPAMYYSFDRGKYLESRTDMLYYNF